MTVTCARVSYTPSVSVTTSTVGFTISYALMMSLFVLAISGDLRPDRLGHPAGIQPLYVQIMRTPRVASDPQAVKLN